MKVIKVIVTTVCFCCMMFNANAQLKDSIGNEHYDLWYEIRQVKSSGNGKWIAHVRTNNASAIYLNDLDKNKEECVEEVEQFDFSDNSNFLFIQKEKEGLLKNLKSGKGHILPKVFSFYWLSVKGSLLLQYKEHVALMDPLTLKQTFFKNEEIISVDNQKAWALLKRKNGSEVQWYIWDFELDKKTVLEDLNPSLENIRLSDDSKSLMGTYMTDSGITNIQVAYYDKGWQVKVMSAKYPEVYSSGSWYFLDGKKRQLYFYSKNKEVKEEETESDRKVKIRNSLSYKTKPSLYLYNCWNFEKDSITTLYREDMTDVLVSSIEGHFIGYSTQNYDPRDFKGIDRADFYLLKNGAKPILIEKEIVKLNKNLLIHQNKPYVTYYKNGHWWSYHLITNEKKCLTKNLQWHFSNSEKSYLSDTDHYGVLGFSSDSDYMLVYDAFDIWKIDLEGNYILKCTDGKPKNITYRFARDTNLKDNQFRDTFFSTHAFSNERLVLRARNNLDYKTAIVSLDKDCNLREILSAEPYRILGVVPLNKDTYLVVRENHSTPPQYVITGEAIVKDKIYQSNKHYSQFKWGKSQIFNIRLDDGIHTNASLIYPASWKPDEKYPLIVYYYEKTSPYGMYYKMPTYDNLDGFNSTLMSQKNFFVLYIDMRYRENEVTRFLLPDTNSVLDHIIEKVPSINKEKLGMIGHSFGGYEVMYLAGQTDRFKAAVAGAGVSDLYDLYYADKNKGSLGMFTVENVQFKTQAPFLNDKFNSMNPLQYIGNINTPMLLWTGENDYRIRKEHSIKMYLGLWRQKKEAYLLIYKDERHFLTKSENKKDLTERIISFFEEKLK